MHTHLPLCAFVFAACASDPALERQYQTLESSQKAIRQEMSQVSSRADRAFSDATALERQTGNVARAAAQCTAPKAAYRPAGPLGFGPVRFKYKEKTFVVAPGGQYETPSWRCSQETVTAR